MIETCLCYLPSESRHCRRCHVTFRDQGEALDHLSTDACQIAECKTCGTAWWLSHSPGAPAPIPGTWCVCVSCGEAAIFTGRGLEVREPSSDENRRIYTDPFILDYRIQREMIRRTGWGFAEKPKLGDALAHRASELDPLVNFFG
jgi:hypothetical protein